jgi:hypothetical protein
MSTGWLDLLQSFYCVFTVLQSVVPDVAITKDVSAGSAVVGSELTYTVKL